MKSTDKLLIAFGNIGVETLGDLSKAIGRHRLTAYRWDSEEAGGGGGEVSRRGRLELQALARESKITLPKDIWFND